MLCKHYRAIDVQALVGNAGGYIGLLLGYSVLQIPEFFLLILKNLKRYFLEIRGGQDRIAPLPIPVASLETSLTKNENAKSNELDLQINDIRVELKRITEKLDKLTEHMTISKMKPPT